MKERNDMIDYSQSILYFPWCEKHITKDVLCCHKTMSLSINTRTGESEVKWTCMKCGNVKQSLEVLTNEYKVE